MSKELEMLAKLMEAMGVPNLVIEIDGVKCLNYAVIPEDSLEQRMNLTIKTLKKCMIDFLNITSYCNYPEELMLFEKLNASGTVLGATGESIEEALKGHKHEDNILACINGFFDLVRKHIDPECPIGAGRLDKPITSKIIAKGGNA